MSFFPINLSVSNSYNLNLLQNFWKTGTALQPTNGVVDTTAF